MLNKKIRLAILGTRGIPARYGGFETFAEELSVRLADDGLIVTVFCEETSAACQYEYRGVQLRYVPAPNLGPFSTLLYDLRCLWLARKDYDVIYLLGYGASLFCFIPRLWRKRIWLNMDGVEWKRSKWNVIARWYLRFMEMVAMIVATRVIADADTIRAFLQSRHGSRTPCSVIPYGASVPDRPPQHASLTELGLLPGGYYLIVCRLEPENHVCEIIDGYLESSSSALLVIVGDYSKNTAYIQKIRSITDDRLKFVGPIYEKDKLVSVRYYCRAYFHGHSVGGTNPSLLEAMGCGNIIVAHDNPFNREVADNCGMYFHSSGDIPAIVQRIEVMDNSAKKELSETARERIEKNYTWELVTDKYHAILNGKY